MIYKFRSKAAGDVIMMGPSGDHVLRILGKEPGPKGIIEPAQMPGAMKVLEEAIAAEEALRKESEEENGKASKGDGISLRQRAWPLVEMMKRAHAADESIVWGV
jgi:hypothetical protein